MMGSEFLEETGQALRTLSTMDRKALARHWAKVFGSPAPRSAQATLMRSALAWHYQIDHEAEAELGQLLRRLPRQATSAARTSVLASGTRLLREWQGQTHHVTVVEGGFEYGGKAYSSLSAIARYITGTAWSGLLFFGLKK